MVGSYWKIISSLKFEGIGLVVERNGQLGYAKGLNYNEMLAADLANLVGAPVPRVELGSVAANGTLLGNFTISHIHSELSRPLRLKGQMGTKRSCYTQAEKSALYEASGLLPFLLWIAASDHGDDTNLVVDDLGNGLYRIVAIDFEHAFHDLGEIRIEYAAPPALVQNINRGLVLKYLYIIESLSPQRINDCCMSSGLAMLAEQLHTRRHRLRMFFEDKGWLD